MLPEPNQQVHGNQRYLVEHEHGEHIGADEEAVNTRREQGEPKEILLGEGLQLPRGKGTSEHDDARQEQHHDRDTVDTNTVGNIKWLEPRRRSRQQHHIGITCCTLLNKIDGQPYGQGQQTRGANHHHATHLIERLGQPKAEQHQGGDYYE